MCSTLVFDGRGETSVSLGGCYANVIEYRAIGDVSPESAFDEWRANCDEIFELLDDFAFFYVRKGEEASGDVYCFSRDGLTDTFPDDEMSDEDKERMSEGEEVDGYTRIVAADAYSRITFVSASAV